MKERTALEGALLRMERLKQQKGQKEICYGICVPSYLSKIEHGSVCPDANILSALFARLGVRYEDDLDILSGYEEKIGEYFYRLEYHLDKRAVYEELKGADETLRFSRYAIDWLLIRGFEGGSGSELLAKLREQMSVRQLGWYYALHYWEHPETRAGYEAAQRSCELLGSADSMASFCSACMLRGDYASIHRMENRMVAVAVEEGNTYSLASYFFLKGNAYACLNMEKMMMDCYERGLRLLQNTAWKDELQIVYYNIGAIYGIDVIVQAYYQTQPWLTVTMLGFLKSAEMIGRVAGGMFQYTKEIPVKKRYAFTKFVYLFYDATDCVLLFLPYPLMLLGRFLCGGLGISSATIRETAVQCYLEPKMRARVNAFFNVAISVGGVGFQLLAGVLGQVMPYRIAVLLLGLVTLVSMFVLIVIPAKDNRPVYEAVREINMD